MKQPTLDVRLHLHLRDAMLCADCEAVFRPQAACPSCASAQVIPLARWLAEVRS
jgi:hypothetical protein